MALIKISDTVMINSNKIDSIEDKNGKTWVSVGSRSYTVDISTADFIKKVGIAEQSEGKQHFAG